MALTTRISAGKAAAGDNWVRRITHGANHTAADDARKVALDGVLGFPLGGRDVEHKGDEGAGQAGAHGIRRRRAKSTRPAERATH